MFTTKDIAQIYETILATPGMNDAVKIDLKLSRKNVLLLNKVIERGLTIKPDDKSPDVLSIIPAESRDELSSVAADFLEKAGLSELNEKLQSFQDS